MVSTNPGQPIRPVRLTDNSIRKLPVPLDGRAAYRDDELKGLALFVTPTGRKTWYLTKRISGRFQRWRLGEWPALNPKAARNTALGILGRGEPGRGKGPRLEEIVDHATATIWATNPTAGAGNVRILKRYSNDLLRLSIDAITTAEVRKRHAEIGVENGHYAANRWRTVIATLFSLAATDMGFDRANPTAGVKPFPEAKRARRLSEAEAERLLIALGDAPQRDADLVKVALFTGARRANVFGLKAEQFDPIENVWLIPAASTKSGAAIRLPVDPRVAEIINRRIADAGAGGWLFPGRRTAQPIRDFTKPFRAICIAANIPVDGENKIRFHDLRRSLASFMADTGASDAVIGKALGHAVSSVTQTYARPDDATIRSAVGRAIDLMETGGGR